MHKEGYTFTWEQVPGMWKTLVTALKKTKDHNNKSGNDRKTCAFEKELDIMFEALALISAINNLVASSFQNTG
jgi:hypothetical protein